MHIVWRLSCAGLLTRMHHQACVPKSKLCLDPWLKNDWHATVKAPVVSCAFFIGCHQFLDMIWIPMAFNCNGHTHKGAQEGHLSNAAPGKSSWLAAIGHQDIQDW